MVGAQMAIKPPLMFPTTKSLSTPPKGDAAVAEIGGIGQGPAAGVGCEGQALVDRPGLLKGVGLREVVPGVVHGDDGVGAGAAGAVKLPGGIDPWVPADNGAILGSK